MPLGFRHYQLHELGVETFFCNVRSPWQKGGVENRIGRLRRFLPRRTDLSALPDLRLAQLAEADNNTSRIAEVFLKCESTHPAHFHAGKYGRGGGVYGNWRAYGHRGGRSWIPAFAGQTVRVAVST